MSMKREFLYSFLASFTYLSLYLAIFFFTDKPTALNTIIVLTIPLIFLITKRYAAKPSANMGNFVVILFAVSLVLHLLVEGMLLKQGLTFLSSLYFWLAMAERIAIPIALPFFNNLFNPRTG